MTSNIALLRRLWTCLIHQVRLPYQILSRSNISVPATDDSFNRLSATRIVSFLYHRAVGTALHRHNTEKTVLLFFPVSTISTSVLLLHHVENSIRGVHEASNVVSLDKKANFTNLCILFDCLLCRVWINVAFPSNYATELDKSNKISPGAAFPSLH